MTVEKQALIDAAQLDIEAAEKELYASGVWLTYENAVHHIDQLCGKPKRNLTAKDANANVPVDVVVTEPKTRKKRTAKDDVDGIELATIDRMVESELPATESDALTIGKLADVCGLDSKVVSASLKRLGAKSIGKKRGTKYYLETETAQEVAY
jgi:hypothetical protein